MKHSPVITKTLLAPAALLALLGLIGCLDNSDNTVAASNNRACSAVIALARSCGILSDGIPPHCGFDADDPEDQCEFACVGMANCTDFNQLTCDDNDDNALGMCLHDCEVAAEASIVAFICSDKSVANLSGRDLCDGWEDCFDGSDELNCPEGTRFSCRDNTEMIPSRFRCDGEIDCLDRSDELDCPTVAMFECTDGAKIPATFRCDQDNDCSDGSDELGCATFCE